MALMIAPVLFIAAIIFVAYPFLTETPEAAELERKETEREKVQKKKEDIIATLKDIEMDFRMGKLSEEDYNSLRSEFEGQAVQAYQDIDSLESDSSLDPEENKI